MSDESASSGQLKDEAKARLHAWLEELWLVGPVAASRDAALIARLEDVIRASSAGNAWAERARDAGTELDWRETWLALPSDPAEYLRFRDQRDRGRGRTLTDEDGLERYLHWCHTDQSDGYIGRYHVDVRIAALAAACPSKAVLAVARLPRVDVRAHYAKFLSELPFPTSPEEQTKAAEAGLDARTAWLQLAFRLSDLVAIAMVVADYTRHRYGGADETWASGVVANLQHASLPEAEMAALIMRAARDLSRADFQRREVQAGLVLTALGTSSYLQPIHERLPGYATDARALSREASRRQRGGRESMDFALSDSILAAAAVARIRADDSELEGVWQWFVSCLSADAAWHSGRVDGSLRHEELGHLVGMLDCPDCAWRKAWEALERWRRFASLGKRGREARNRYVDENLDLALVGLSAIGMLDDGGRPGDAIRLAATVIPEVARFAFDPRVWQHDDQQQEVLVKCLFALAPEATLDTIVDALPRAPRVLATLLEALVDRGVWVERTDADAGLARTEWTVDEIIAHERAIAEMEHEDDGAYRRPTERTQRLDRLLEHFEPNLRRPPRRSARRVGRADAQVPRLARAPAASSSGRHRGEP